LKEGGAIDDDGAKFLRSVRLPKELKVDPELSNLPSQVLKRKRELLELGLSTYYVDLCFQALSQGIVSAGRIAEMMQVNDFELAEIATLFGLSVRSI
jgi:hypothetical protein